MKFSRIECCSARMRLRFGDEIQTGTREGRFIRVHQRQGRLYGSLARRTTVDGLPRAYKFINFDQKNGHSSKSVNSFGAGPIFLGSLGQDLSRNAFVVSVYAFQKKSDRRKDFLVTPKKSKIFDFFEFSQNESRSFDRVSRIIQECSRRVSVMVILFLARKKNSKKSIFRCLHDRF